MNSRIKWEVALLISVALSFGTGCQLGKKPAVNSVLPEKEVVAKHSSPEKTGGAIDKILMYRLGQKDIDDLEKQTGLTRASFFIDEKAYRDFLLRVMANANLKKAVKKAQSEHIYIFVADHFSAVEGSSIFIDVKASDSQIISFLLGP